MLICLKIPAGWAIVRNSFADCDPIVENGVIVNDEFFSEDLLSIEQLQFKGTHWITDQQGYVLDLGWYPEADPLGSYRLTLLRGNWDNIIFEYRSINRYNIKTAIEASFKRLLDLKEEKISDYSQQEWVQYLNLYTLPYLLASSPPPHER